MSKLAGQYTGLLLPFLYMTSDGQFRISTEEITLELKEWREKIDEVKEQLEELGEDVPQDLVEQTNAFIPVRS